MTAAGGGFRAVDGAALIVASVVGAGIFTVPGYVARLAGSSSLALGLWAVGGAIALAGALCYAELAARIPRGGAEYVYLREAFGERVGFLSGWTSFIAGFSGAIAAAAVGFAAHLILAFPEMARSGGSPMALQTLIALGLIWGCTAISIAGVRMSRLATNLLTVLILAGMVVLTVAGTRMEPMPYATSPTAVPMFAALGALVPIFFTYSGWNAAAYITAEFRHPTRDVPRALIGGTVVVTLLYLGLNLATLRAIPPSVLALLPAPVAEASRVLLGSAGSAVVTLLALAALASSVCAMVITGPRIYAEMAADGVLPRMFAATGSGAARSSVIAQSAWSSVLVLTGTFEQIITYTGFAILLFSSAAVCGLIVLRRRHGRPQTFAVPWYPLVPLAFIGCTLLIALASFRYAPGPSLVGIALIAAGLPLRGLARSRVISALTNPSEDFRTPVPPGPT